MTKYQIVLSHKAREDIIDIGDYIAYVLNEPENSKKFINSLRQSIIQLQFFPKKFPLVQPKKFEKLRRMTYKNYYVFYEVKEKEHKVFILRIGHSCRNWKEILRKYLLW